MSAINASATPLERLDWWVSTLGTCVVCGAPLEYPTRQTVGGHTLLARKTEVATLLFKYDLICPMEEGHLIDRYIIENMRRIQSADYLWAANLRKQDMWDPRVGAQLSRVLDEAMKNTVPVCKDCNIAMTKENSEVLAVFYGLLRDTWFIDGMIPFNTLRTTRKNLSVPKTLEAIFLFFTLQPKPPESSGGDQVSGGGDADEDADAAQQWERVSKLLTRTNLDDEESRLVIGLPVRKYFPAGPAGWYDGKVVRFDFDENKNLERIFEVLFSDGDREDLSWPELVRIRVTKDTPPASGGPQQTAATGKKAKPKPNAKAKTKKKQKQPGDADGAAAGMAALALDGGAATSSSSDDDDETTPLVWMLKNKEEVWRDVAIVKTVSHLMQWGATKLLRHRALAVFWSGYYLWLTFLTPSEQLLMSFVVWYARIFRQFYMLVYPDNDWFSHDTLTVAQLTNVNTTMQTDPQGGLAVQWVQWVRQQLDVMKPDIEGLSRLVFDADPTLFRFTEIVEEIEQKPAISKMFDEVREKVRGWESMLTVIHRSLPEEGLSRYFEWYVFALRGMHNLPNYVREFKRGALEHIRKAPAL